MTKLYIVNRGRYIANGHGTYRINDRRSAYRAYKEVAALQVEMSEYEVVTTDYDTALNEYDDAVIRCHHEFNNRNYSAFASLEEIDIDFRKYSDDIEEIGPMPEAKDITDWYIAFECETGVCFYPDEIRSYGCFDLFREADE